MITAHRIYPRAAYVVEQRPEVILVRDLDGQVSVTNDAENVVAAVLASYGTERPIVYCDTEGNWDQLIHDGIAFTGFAPIDIDDRVKWGVPPDESR